MYKFQTNLDCTAIIIGLLLNPDDNKDEMIMAAESSNNGMFIEAKDVGEDLENAFKVAASKFDRATGIKLESLR